MNVGLCWPSPGAQPQPFDEVLLRRVRDETRLTHLRIDVHHAQPAADQMVTASRNAGFEVLPILAFDYDKPDIRAYSAFCRAFVSRHRFPAVELGNEPHIMHNMAPEAYAGVFTAGAKAVRAAGTPTQIYIAGEATKPIGTKIDYFKNVRAHVADDSLFDVMSIHPYRNPKPPKFAPFKSRDRELHYYQSQLPDGKGVAVTEIGWDLRDGVTEQLQAQYIREELSIWESLGVDAAYIFQHTDPPPHFPGTRWGMYRYDWSARPAVAEVAAFQQSRGVA